MAICLLFFCQSEEYLSQFCNLAARDLYVMDGQQPPSDTDNPFPGKHFAFALFNKLLVQLRV